MISNSERLYLGWDIGGTKCAAVVGTHRGEILARKQWPSFAQSGPHAMLAQFTREADLLRKCFPQIEAVGVSVGGPLNTLTGVVLSPPHLPGWDNIALRAQLESLFHLPVFVEHDAVACLQAERLWGAARGLTHAVYLTAGTGCGGAILCGGHILRGPQGQTTELGHVRLAENGPLAYGKKGCVESFCSGTGVSELAHFRFPKKFGARTDLFEVERSARAGEPEGLAVVRESGKYLGRTCALLVDIFCLQRVIVGSLARYLPDIWMEEARAEMAREMLPQYVDAAVEIVPTGCKDQLQDLSSFAPCVCALGEAVECPTA